MAGTTLEFLNVTFYVDDTRPLKEFYCDGLGLPLDYEQPGRLAAMGPVGAHDLHEGDAPGSVRLYFLAEDVAAIASAAERAGIVGTMALDGGGAPMWTTTDPAGRSVRVLTKPR